MRRKTTFNSNPTPMFDHVQNEQGYLAERFSIQEDHIRQSAKLALLKIKSWKFAHTTPEMGLSYQQDMDQLISNAFFQFVPNTHILSEEGYYFSPTEN